MDDRLRDVEIKLSAVAQRVDDHEVDISQRFAPLVTEVHEVRWTLDKIREEFGQDMREAHDALRQLSSRLDGEREERIRGQADRRREIEEARAERQAEFALLEADRAKELAAQEKLNLEMRDRDEQRKLENRRLFYGIAAVFLSSLATVLVSLVGGTPS